MKNNKKRESMFEKIIEFVIDFFAGTIYNNPHYKRFQLYFYGILTVILVLLTIFLSLK